MPIARGEVAAGDELHLPRPQLPVDRVDRGEMDLDRHLAGTRCGQLEHVEVHQFRAAVLVVLNSLHEGRQWGQWAEIAHVTDPMVTVLGTIPAAQAFQELSARLSNFGPFVRRMSKADNRSD